MITKEEKEKIIKDYGQDLKNTGLTEVQIALLDYRIRDLNEHFKTAKKDFASKLGLIKMVNKRRKLIKYLKKKDAQKCQNLLNKLEENKKKKSQ